KISMLLIVDEAAAFGIVERRVADLVLVNAKVVVKEDAHLAVAATRVLQKNVFEVDIPVPADHIVTLEFDAERLVHEFDISYGRFRKVADRALPIVLKDPGKNTVHPDTEAKREALAVVLF